MTAPPSEIEAKRRKLALLLRREELKAEHPLAYARIWHAEGVDTDPHPDYPSGRPRTSQRRALNLCVGTVATAVLGGNGAGKTELVSQLAVACAQGRDHPDTARWLRENQLDPELVPPYPGRVLVSALTGNDSKRVVRRKVNRYLPAGAKWANQNGDGEAYAYPLGKATADGGGTIVFKSNDQGADKHQADEYDLIIGDEEHDEEVFEEWLGRMGRRPWKGGYIVLSMTPLKGFTWVYRDFLDKPKEGYKSAEIHGLDNPHIDQAGRRRRFSGLSAARRAAREFGRFAAITGRVYDAFDRRIHVVPSFTPPSDWIRYQGIDWGARAPHVLWAAEDPRGRVVVYRELAPRRAVEDAPIRLVSLLEGMRASEAVEHTEESDPPVWYRVADSEDPSAILEAAYAGVQLMPAPKGPGSVLHGITLVQAMLACTDGYTGEEREPTILITEDCATLIRELEGMRWLPQKVGQDPKPDPSCADHGPDALRYICEMRQGLGIG